MDPSTDSQAFTSSSCTGAANAVSPKNAVRFSDMAPQAAVQASVHPINSDWHCVRTTFDDPANALNTATHDLEKNIPICPSPVIDSPKIQAATKEELENIVKGRELPKKPANRAFRYLRWNFFSLYRRLFALVFILNLVALVTFLSEFNKYPGIVTYSHAATAASANFCIGILMRNEHVVNALFRVALLLRPSAPLVIRRYCAKVYSYGGIHSACGISGAMWYLAFTGLIINRFLGTEGEDAALAVTTAMTVMLLLVILVFAHPYMRTRLHNQFETTHRYCGWTAMACLWAQTLVMVWTQGAAQHSSFGTVLVRSPPFWFLVVITCCIVYPWTRLRSRKVQVEHLSKHATRLHFDYCDMEPCVGVRLTDAPLEETHGFATIPNYKGTPGFTVLVSNAGDWTNKIISNPPDRIWVKGAPTIGVMRVALMFKKVLVVATGSGIGPCLSLLQSRPDYPMRVVWSSQSPATTYGAGIINAVYRADPDAVIVDTRKTGRGDLLALAYALYKESESEAVVVISNPKVTFKVVYGLETRGVPAYGAIFDS